MPRSSRRNSNTAAAADSDNEGSVASSSVGSRQSSRLKRKRLSLNAAAIDEEDAEEEEEELLELPPRSTRKRPKKKTKTAASSPVQEGDDESDDEDEDVEMSEGEDADMNGEDEDEEEEDGKLPASEISIPNGHHYRHENNNGQAASAVAVAVSAEGNGKARATSSRASSSKEKRPPAYSNNSASAARKPAAKQETPKMETIVKENGGDSGNKAVVAEQAREEKTTGANAVVAAPQQQQQEAPPQESLYEQTQARARLFIDSVVNSVLPSGEVVEEGEVDAAAADPQEKKALHRTRVWFIVFLIFQVVFYPIFLNPILSTTVSGSKVALSLYKGMFGSSTSSTALNSKDKDDEMEQNRRIIQDKTQQIQRLMYEVNAASANRESAVNEYTDKAKGLQNAVSRYEASVQYMVSKLSSLVQHLEHQNNDPAPPNLGVVRRLLDAHAASTLIDLAPVKLWEIPDCGSSSDDSTASSLKLEELERTATETKSIYTDLAVEITGSSETKDKVRAWLQRMLDTNGAGSASKVSSSSSGLRSTTGNSQLERVLEKISSRINLEIGADGTGKSDYAALFNGAEILDASRSLVDDLPLFNRVAALLSLRFYGHGPEAALTPTSHPTALGQCWSFQQQPGSDEFGRLTVRLARPIYVDTVSIEHPPREVTDRVDTAIREFRVYGFEDEYARGKAWSLGSFEYDIEDDDDDEESPIRQEFMVEDEEDDQDVPALRAIRLTIDSNWGGEYACLYRFRVHGEEKEDYENNEEGEDDADYVENDF